MTEAPTPKPGILDIAPYVGGKSKIDGVAEPMKLSSNENMLGAGEKARAAYEAAIRNIHIYPDGRASKLRAAVAAHHGLEPERLIFGNGSDEVFALLNQTYLTPGDDIVTGQYGFLAYRISALANQASVRLAPEPEFKATPEALLEQVTERTRIVYVSSPSNPTGSYNTPDEIRRLHEGLRPDVLLVIDEAYAEYVTEADWETSFDLARTSQNVVVTRTFSKIHGLGGLRIGFGYAPLKVAEAVDRIRLPFNVSVPGLEAAVAALGDEAHQKASRDLIQTWCPRLTQSLRGFGFDVLPSAGNFVLIRFKDVETCQAANDWLNQKGIIVRPVGGYGLPECLRITVGTDDQNRAVLDAMSEFAAR
ncbi:MAG: histidinol-phosphate transaminase [Alphaproteobacteria bacterium]|nr:histidinol-phosphate transaminase [Alphaproteobacteria bacterium]MBU1527320.1 histidinol-phosphate transaminase [Alphaproteobacteria bacterium]MBU2117186.1 histidinol-phosphate transaminase [Alphaproteobacteria bacterium]MBU2352320.1 histidinol-phosphate transaminase [Alphaproteobacteria bacterium]MBU2383616.1 histidinol-phosphate transaminase [Alphaproteobacteria bacterium]